eukprot:1607092-Rhodomonas_salina.2
MQQDERLRGVEALGWLKPLANWRWVSTRQQAKSVLCAKSAALNAKSNLKLLGCAQGERESRRGRTIMTVTS